MVFPSGSSAALTIGVAGTYKLSPIWGVGLFYQNYSVSAQTTSSTASASVTTTKNLFGGELNIFFEGSLKGFIIGTRMGLMSSSAQADASDTSSSITFGRNSTNFFIAPKLGYDVLLGRFSVGGEFSYGFGFDGYTPQVLSILAAGKFWF